MGLDNPIHIAFLLVLLLLVFGAKRLPEMGRSLGSGLRGFKESLTGENTERALPASASPTGESATGAAAGSTNEGRSPHLAPAVELDASPQQTNARGS
jgi:sec-independent protein translocase protein TatA